MKISSPTKVTITSMTAASGYNIHPSFTHPDPNCIQGKLKNSRSGCPSRCAKATTASTKEKLIEVIAMAAANLRCSRLRSAPMPAARRGSTGINQRYRTIQTREAMGRLTASSTLGSFPAADDGCPISRSFFARCPDFLYAASSNGHLCGFHRGKPHEVHQRQQTSQEIRGCGIPLLFPSDSRLARAIQSARKLSQLKTVAVT